MTLTKVATNKSFGGVHDRYEHQSMVTNTAMRFAIFLPPQVEQGVYVPVLYWLSGLTCTDENFMQKAGAQRLAAELGIAIIAPDTSPRGEQVANDDGYDLGQGAGFYVNATQAPWSEHYRMYDYITDELPQLIEANFPVTSNRAICGHSMGGHGALMIALRNPDMYVSASAFSPISNPMNCPWGKKAFGSYLGEDEQLWRQYDSAVLMSEAEQKVPMLADQGLADDFLSEQLMPEALKQAAEKSAYPLTMRLHEGYDHSYFFIASFIEDHLRFHFKHLTMK